MATGNGDFRWPKVQALMAEADVVVTNPPFSLFIAFLGDLLRLGKDFLIIGNYNAVSYKSVFQAFVAEQVHLGVSPRGMSFTTPQNGMQKFGNTVWFTSIRHGVKPEPLVLTQKYDPAIHPKYDNYDAIEVSRLKQIPYDYFEPMGVPITYLARHHPDGFEIVEKELTPTQNVVYVAGKAKYGRVMIQRKAQFDITGLNTCDGKYLYLAGQKKYDRIVIQRKAKFDILGTNRSLGVNTLYVDGIHRYHRIVIQRKLDDTGPVV